MANRLNTSIRNEIASISPLLNTIAIPRVDPVTADQQARYRADGLSYISNNESIIPRDGAGNIILDESSSTNPLLIIDPVTELITTKSALRILDTSFQYYKFPVTIRPSDDIEDLVVDLDFESDAQDIIYARYKPNDNQAIQTSNSEIAMDIVVEGISQIVTNKYYITKEIKNSGKDLNFYIKINHRYDGDGYGTSYFHLYKSGPETELNKQFSTFASNAFDGKGWGYIKQYEVQDAILEVTILNESFDIGDEFSIGAQAGQGLHTITADQSYWVITDASKDVDLWNQPAS
jgi:hypothetical protein